MIRKTYTSIKLKKPVTTGTSSLSTKPVFDKNYCQVHMLHSYDGHSPRDCTETRYLERGLS